MPGFTIDFPEKQLQAFFKDYKKANAIITRETLNNLAGKSYKNAQTIVDRKFINRNEFTKRNIQFRKATGTDISSMESRMGATEKASYMALQDQGGTRKPKTGPNLTMAQLSARNGSKKRVISRRLRINNVSKNIVKGKFTKNFKSKKAKNVARAAVAYKKRKFMSYKKNIYSVSSFKKNRSGVDFKKRHLYNLSKQRANVKKRPWLIPSIKKPIRNAQDIFNKQTDKLMQRMVL